ncbi:MAG: hypothetical protein ACI901_001245 [Octadecabacter sp.]|jgi:hypothetical protein
MFICGSHKMSPILGAIIMIIELPQLIVAAMRGLFSFTITPLRGTLTLKLKGKANVRAQCTVCNCSISILNEYNEYAYLKATFTAI